VDLNTGSELPPGRDYAEGVYYALHGHWPEEPCNPNDGRHIDLVCALKEVSARAAAKQAAGKSRGKV
jgi:hypothetical protein